MLMLSLFELTTAISKIKVKTFIPLTMEKIERGGLMVRRFEGITLSQVVRGAENGR